MQISGLAPSSTPQILPLILILQCKGSSVLPHQPEPVGVPIGPNRSGTCQLCGIAYMVGDLQLGLKLPDVQPAIILPQNLPPSSSIEIGR